MKTTYEMDGLLTDEDIRNKDTVVYQCRKCKKWTMHISEEGSAIDKHVPCSGCGEIAYDPTSVKSFRTYNASIDNKRKPK